MTAVWAVLAGCGIGYSVISGSGRVGANCERNINNITTVRQDLRPRSDTQRETHWQELQQSGAPRSSAVHGCNYAVNGRQAPKGEEGAG